MKRSLEVTLTTGGWWEADHTIIMRIPRNGTHRFDRGMFERLTGITVNGRTRVRITFTRVKPKSKGSK